jgi:hypothetical protein
MWGAHWTIGLEKRKIPSVYVVGEPFIEDVKVTLDKEGMPYLRTVNVPHPCGLIPDDQYSQIIPELVNALTKPLTAGEKQSGLALSKRIGRIAMAGTLDEIQDYFYQHKWTDGLPIIPPTEEKIRSMLKPTSHQPDEIVTTTMWPEKWEVTVEKVATVGAMAGCIPESMPVLLALVDAWGSGNFISSVRSTTSFSFPIVVSGPIRTSLGMNTRTNAMGPGNRVNSTIGRFLRLSIICLGGSWPGSNDMSSQGSPLKYSFCIPENEEENPWEPFHVSQGYKREDSTVAIFTGGWSHFGRGWGHEIAVVDLDRIAKAIVPYTLRTGAVVLLDPLVAQGLAAQKMSKQDVEEYIWSHATTTAKEFRTGYYYEEIIKPALQKQISNPGNRLVSWPAEYLNLPDDAIIPAYPSGSIRVIVVGGKTNPHAQTWQLANPSIASIDKWR